MVSALDAYHITTNRQRRPVIRTSDLNDHKQGQTPCTGPKTVEQAKKLGEHGKLTLATSTGIFTTGCTAHTKDFDHLLRPLEIQT